MDDSTKLEPPDDILRQLDEISEILEMENEVEEDHSHVSRPEILVTEEDSLDTELQTDHLIGKLDEEKTVCDSESQKAPKILEIGEKSADLDSNEDVHNKQPKDGSRDLIEKLTSRLDHPALISENKVQENVKCDVCNREFKSSKLLLHKRSGPLKYLHQCDVCKEYCSSVKAVRIHVQLHQTGPNPFTKVEIKTEYHGRKKLWFFCGKCDVPFLGRWSLIHHLNTIHCEIPNPDGVTECHICQMYFSSRRLTKHLKNSHGVSRVVSQRKMKHKKNQISPSISVSPKLPDATRSIKRMEVSRSSDSAMKNLISMAKKFQRSNKFSSISFLEKKTPDSCAESIYPSDKSKDQQAHTSDLTRKIQALPRISERTVEQLPGLTECSRSSHEVPTDTCVDMRDSTDNNLSDDLAQVKNKKTDTVTNTCLVWKCLFCDTFFGFRSNMLQHVRIAHKNSKYYGLVSIRRCPTCMLFMVGSHSCNLVVKDISPKWSQVYTAFKLWAGTGFFCCPICGALSGPISVLVNHMNQTHNRKRDGEDFTSSASAGCRNKQKVGKNSVWGFPKMVTIFQCIICNLFLIQLKNHMHCSGQSCVTFKKVNSINWLGLFSCHVCGFKNCFLDCLVKHMNTTHSEKPSQKVSSQVIGTKAADTRHTGSDMIKVVVETDEGCYCGKNAAEKTDLECSDEHKEPSDNFVVTINCEGEDVGSIPKRPILQQPEEAIISRKRKKLNYCDMNSGKVAGKFIKAKFVPKEKRKSQLEKSRSAKGKSKTGKMRKGKGDVKSFSVVSKRPILPLPHPNAITSRRRKKLNYSDMNSGR